MILVIIYCFFREGVFVMIVELVVSIIVCIYSVGYIIIIFLVVYIFLF